MKNYMFNIPLKKANNSKPEKSRKKWKILKLIIVFIIIAMITSIFVLYEKDDKVRNFFDVYIFRKVTNEEKLPSVELDTSKNVNVFAYSKYLVLLEQNVLKLYNKSGTEEHSLDIEISNPIFVTNGDYLCIAEKNGQKIYLISNKNIVWQKDIEGNISDINVNKNGYVSVTISGTSYKAVIETIDAKGDELFKKYLSTTNVIDTDISNDNKYLAIAEANFSGIVVQSNIEIISIEDAKNNEADSIKNKYTAKANDLIINVKYNNKNDLICMYDEHIDVLKQEESTELVNLTEGKILFADINLSSKILKFEKKSDGIMNSYIEMQIINSNNINDVNSYKIEKTPKKVYTQGNMTAVNLGTSVLFIDSNGWLVKKYESHNNEEIQNIVICNGIAGIISKNKVYIISL